MTVEELPTHLMPAVQDYDAGLSACRNQKIIGFMDGQTALGYHAVGDYLELGPRSANKYARDLWCESMALLRAENGAAIYGLGYGRLIIMDKPETYILSTEPIHLTIGQSCVLPGLFTTEPISQAMLCYKPFAAAQEHTRGEDGELAISPFIELAARAIAAHSES